MLTLSSRPTPASRFSDRCAFSAGPRLSLNSGFARSAVVFVWQSVDLACTAPSKFSFACTHTHARAQCTPLYFHLKLYGSVKCVYECVVCVYREGVEISHLWPESGPMPSMLAKLEQPGMQCTAQEGRAAIQSSSASPKSVDICTAQRM